MLLLQFVVVVFVEHPHELRLIDLVLLVQHLVNGHVLGQCSASIDVGFPQGGVLFVGVFHDVTERLQFDITERAEIAPMHSVVLSASPEKLHEYSVVLSALVLRVRFHHHGLDVSQVSRHLGFECGLDVEQFVGVLVAVDVLIFCLFHLLLGYVVLCAQYVQVGSGLLDEFVLEELHTLVVLLQLVFVLVRAAQYQPSLPFELCLDLGHTTPPPLAVDYGHYGTLIQDVLGVVGQEGGFRSEGEGEEPAQTYWQDQTAQGEFY